MTEKGFIKFAVKNIEGVSYAFAEASVKFLRDAIQLALAKDDEIKLPGIGNFKVITMKEHPGYMFEKKKVIVVPETKVIKFYPSKILTDVVRTTEYKK